MRFLLSWVFFCFGFFGFYVFFSLFIFDVDDDGVGRSMCVRDVRVHMFCFCVITLCCVCVVTFCAQQAVRFIDYAPMVFRKLREHFGVSSENYLRSVGPEQLLVCVVCCTAVCNVCCVRCCVQYLPHCALRRVTWCWAICRRCRSWCRKARAARSFTTRPMDDL